MFLAEVRLLTSKIYLLVDKAK